MDPQRREALSEAVLMELAEMDYADFSLLEALKRAGLGMAEFEAEFSSLDECLFAEYDRLTSDLVSHSGAACGAEAEWPTRVRVGLSALLEELAARPRAAQVLIRKFPTIRPAAYERYARFLSDLAALLSDGRRYSGLEDDLPAEVELLAVGAAESLIFTQVDGGHAERLPEMLPEILFSILVPFIGPDRAADEMRNAAAVG